MADALPQLCHNSFHVLNVPHILDNTAQGGIILRSEKNAGCLKPFIDSF